MKPPIRILAACLAIVTVLFSQLALASYACPFLAAPVEMTAPMPEGPCGRIPMDSEQPALCHAHGQQGDQSSAQSPAAVPDMVVLPALPTVRAADPGAEGRAAGEQLSLLTRATAPSVALRHCCLRI